MFGIILVIDNLESYIKLNLNLRAKSAQAVKDMVTQENLGIWYSNAMFFDNYDSDEYENDPNYRETSQIGSGDSFVPKKERLTWRYKLGGLSSVNNVSEKCHINKTMYVIILIPC